MPEFGVVYLVGFAVAFVAQLVMARSTSFVILNMAFWTALGWPLWVIGLALGFALKAIIPDRTE